ncbi:MAG: hypothetical protein L6R36_001609 [Xanthoria steineri]|nr:MAG: hypothetical protein L6R36_001609 [Xanthoria steineri]
MAARNFSIAFHPKPIPCILSNKSSSPNATPNTTLQPLLIFTHGAGGTLTSPAIANFSAGFSRQLPILCFQGNSNLGSRTKMFSAVIEDQKTPTSLGGRSMGARAAVMAATEATKHFVLISYPLHTGDQLRDQILLDISPSVKVIFVSGDRDSMCDLTRLNVVRSKMRCQTWRIVIEGADHGMDMKPKKFTEAVGIKTGEVVAEWIKQSDHTRREGRIVCNDDGQVEWTGWMTASPGSMTLPEAMQETAMARKATPDLAIHSKNKPEGNPSSKAKSTSKRPKRTATDGAAENDHGSKRVKTSTHNTQSKDPVQDSVSTRTRAATKPRLT